MNEVIYFFISSIAGFLLAEFIIHFAFHNNGFLNQFSGNKLYIFFIIGFLLFIFVFINKEFINDFNSFKSFFTTFIFVLYFLGFQSLSYGKFILRKENHQLKLGMNYEV
jgi:hypothetical protein